MAEVVRGISFTLGRERLGIVGESGSGKSQTGRALIGLTAPGGIVSAAQLRYRDLDLLACPPAHLRSAGPCAEATSRWCCKTPNTR